MSPHRSLRPRLKPALISLTGLALAATGVLAPLPALAGSPPDVTHDAQIVDGNAFLSNGYAEFGARPNGSFGSAIDAPAGYHPLTNNADTLGFRVDRDKDGWGVGVDDGDFFTPGGPWEGWRLQVGAAEMKTNTYQSTAIVGSYSAPTSGPGGASVTWSSAAPVDGVGVTQLVTIGAGSRSIHVDITLTNTTGATLTDILYARDFDADNCVMRTEPVCDTNGDGLANGKGVYETWNTIVAQRAEGDDASIVSADQTDGSYIDLRSTATGSLVGFGYCQSRETCTAADPKGTRKFADELVFLTIETPSLAPGASRTFRFSYVLVEDEAIPEPPPVKEPTVGSVNTRARAIIGGKHRVPATCRTRGADLRACKVTLTAKDAGERIVVGRAKGHFAAAEERRGVVRVPLNRRGRALVHRLGGVKVKVSGVVRAVKSSGPVTRTDRTVLLPRVVRLDPVLFEASSTQVGAPDRAALVKISKRLDHVRLIRIIGHADDRGGAARNQELGGQRAEAVRSILGRGNGGIRMEVSSQGERSPVADNSTAKGRAQNRRAMVVIRY